MIDGPAGQILAAFPGKDDLHRKVRMALLAALWAGQDAELELDALARILGYAIEDPPWSVMWAGDTDAIRTLAARLREAARRLEIAGETLTLAAPHWLELDNPKRTPVYWRRPESGETQNDVDLRQPRDDDIPF